MTYAVRGFVDGLRGQLEEIRAQQWDVAWRNFVDEAFRDEKTGAPTRQRNLVLDLSSAADLVPISELSTLTPRLARAYAGKSSKTVTRDVNALIARGLMARVGARVHAGRETRLAFLPPRKAG